MMSLLGRLMENTSNKLISKKKRDVAYYRQRQKNRVFGDLVSFLAKEMEERGITKKDLAAALAKDPAQITRLFSGPSNFELDTLSDILLAFDAEMDHSIVRFKDRPIINYAHPAIAPYAGDNSSGKPQTTGASATTTTTTRPLVVNRVGQGSVDAHVKVSAS